jgi:hypothetical protein
VIRTRRQGSRRYDERHAFASTADCRRQTAPSEFTSTGPRFASLPKITPNQGRRFLLSLEGH